MHTTYPQDIWNYNMQAILLWVNCYKNIIFIQKARANIYKKKKRRRRIKYHPVLLHYLPQFKQCVGCLRAFILVFKPTKLNTYWLSFRTTLPSYTYTANIRIYVYKKHTNINITKAYYLRNHAASFTMDN